MKCDHGFEREQCSAMCFWNFNQHVEVLKTTSHHLLMQEQKDSFKSSTAVCPAKHTVAIIYTA